MVPTVDLEDLTKSTGETLAKRLARHLLLAVRAP